MPEDLKIDRRTLLKTAVSAGAQPLPHPPCSRPMRTPSAGARFTTW